MNRFREAISALCEFTNSTRLAITFVALTMVGFGSPQRLHAVPVTYQLIVFGVNGTPTFPEIPGPVVQVGNNTYGAIGHEVKVTFTFQGDTSNVDAYSIPGASGYEIRMGTASVLVEDAGNVVFQGTFDPSAGIFVSIDNTNLGIGFGSHAVWPPTATAFGEPVYPIGYYIWYLPQSSTYDLMSNFNTGLIDNTGIVDGWSCTDGPAEIPCSTPPSALPLTNGETLTFGLLTASGSIAPNPVGYFETTVNPVIDFSHFTVRAALEDEDHHQTFGLRGRFSLGATSNGINPLLESVTLNVNGFSVVLPPGSFKLQRGSYRFRGFINGNPLEMSITPDGNSSYTVSAQGRGSNLGGSPISIGLTIGDDTGTATAKSLDDEEE